MHENENVQEVTTELDDSVFEAAWADEPIEEAKEEPAEEAAAEEEETEEEADQPESEEEAKPEQKAETFTLRYMKQDKSYSKDEVTSLAQKGLDYDRIRAERDELKKSAPELNEYKTFVEELAKDAGMDVADLIECIRADRLVKQEREAGRTITDTAAREQIRREKTARDKDSAEQDEEAPAAEEPPKKEESHTSKEDDIRAFCEEYPEVDPKDIPKEVWDKVRDGFSLSAAYAKHQNKVLEDRIKVLEQNEKNKNRSTGSRKSSGGSHKDVYDAAWDSADY